MKTPEDFLRDGERKCFDFCEATDCEFCSDKLAAVRARDAEHTAERYCLLIRVEELEGALEKLSYVAEEAATVGDRLIRRWMLANGSELRRRVEAARCALAAKPGTP